MKRLICTMVPVACLILAGGAYAADMKASGDLGRSEFMNGCVMCHGVEGKGGGSVVELLKKVPADLTTLARRNAGKFPEERVRAMVDGREIMAGHGDRDMPVWGNRYSKDGVKAAEYYGDVKYDMEMYTKGRIDALVGYLKRIQAR